MTKLQGRNSRSKGSSAAYMVLISKPDMKHIAWLARDVHLASYGKKLKAVKAPFNTSTAKSTSSLPILRFCTSLTASQISLGLQFHACVTSSEFSRFLRGVTQCNPELAAH